MYKPPKRNEVFLVSLMIIASLAIVYGIYHFNPYFMNRKPLSESLSENQNKSLTIPMAQMEAESLGPWKYLEHKNLSRTFVNDNNFQMETTYVRESTKKLLVEVHNEGQPPLWSADSDGFYFTYPNQVLKTNFSSEKLWFFKAQEGDRISNMPIVGSNYLFVSTNDGFIYKLHKDTGKLAWLLKINGSLQHNFVPYKSFLFFITQEGDEEYYIYKMNGQTGEQVWKHSLIGLTDPSAMTINESLKLILITDPNGSLLCLDFK